MRTAPIQSVSPDSLQVGKFELKFMMTPEYENTVVFGFVQHVQFIMTQHTRTYYKKYDLKIVGDIMIKRGNDNVNTFSWQHDSYNKSLYFSPLLANGLTMLGGSVFWRICPNLTFWRHKAAGQYHGRITLMGAIAENDVMHIELRKFAMHLPERISTLTLARKMNKAYSDSISAEMERIEKIRRVLDEQENYVRNHSFSNALRNDALNMEQRFNDDPAE